MLSKQDENDLLGLISGLGTGESDARASDLLKKVPEAKSFCDDMKQLGGLVEQTPDCDAEPFDTATLERITAGVSSRLRKRSSRRFWAGLAAAAAFTLAVWGIKNARELSLAHEPLGKVWVIDRGFWSGQQNVNTSRPLTNGETLSTSNGQAAFACLPDGVTLILGPQSSAILQRNLIILKSGEAFLMAKGKASFNIESVAGELDSGSSLISIHQDRLGLSVYEGTLSARAGADRPITLPKGHRIDWNKRESAFTVAMPEVAPLPSWAEIPVPQSAN